MAYGKEELAYITALNCVVRPKDDGGSVWETLGEKPASAVMNLILPKSRFLWLHFCCRQYMGLTSIALT